MQQGPGRYENGRTAMRDSMEDSLEYREKGRQYKGRYVRPYYIDIDESEGFMRVRCRKYDAQV